MIEEEPTCHHCSLPLPTGRRSGPGPWFCCFGCRFAHQLALPSAELAAGERPSSPPSTLLLRLGLGIFLALNIMVASWLAYAPELFGASARAHGTDAVLPALFSYLALFLCTLLVVMLGFPLLADAVHPFAPPAAGGRRLARLIPARLNAQTLIVIGVFAAYLLSAVHTFRGTGSLYYDTAALVLVIVTLGSYLEAGAKQRASTAASRLLATLPAHVRVRQGHTVCEVPVDQVRPDDLVQVRPGEAVPVDGEVVEGTSRVDEASLTGESRPRAVEPGAHLLAGALSLDGQLLLRAERVGDDTALALMEHALVAARAGRPPIQRQADRVAAVFVPAVVVLALAVFAYHTWQGQPGEGLLSGLAVLLISCPCALGLAAPLACWHGLRRAAENGILIDTAATLERAALVDRLFMDKTGTLTQPEPALEQIAVAPGIDPRQALAWAAGLESASAHPIARALVEVATGRGIGPPFPEAAAAVPGLGVEGRIDDRPLRLGSAHWVARRGLDGEALARQAEKNGAGAVFLMDDTRLLARFDLAETLRPGAAEAVTSLQRLGIEVSILSGDHQGPTQRLATRLGVQAESALLPDDKTRRLTAMRSAGRCLAMVGDGINDAPVLAAADIGIALGSASDLAQRSGNIRLLSDRLDRIPMLLRIARDTRRRIRANLLWAFGFNTVGIALAVAGWLTPVFAAAAMVLSSLTVVRTSRHAGRLVAAGDPTGTGEGIRTGDIDHGSGAHALAVAAGTTALGLER